MILLFININLKFLWKKQNYLTWLIKKLFLEIVLTKKGEGLATEEVNVLFSTRKVFQ